VTSFLHQEWVRVPLVPRPVERWVIVGIVVAGLVLSGIAPRDRGTWLMEVIWVLIGLPIVVLVWRRFPLTRLLCWLLACHALVLCYGGHYTYAETPLGDWVRDVLDLQRNNYDRLGHFVQGFVPAILVREILIRRSVVTHRGWLFVLVTSVCLAFSAFFELLEWTSALILGSGADAFLATQGDMWDTQWDMFLALCGALLSQLLLSRWHDHQFSPAPSDVRRPTGIHA
jgi:putative membrane protein